MERETTDTGTQNSAALLKDDERLAMLLASQSDRLNDSLQEVQRLLDRPDLADEFKGKLIQSMIRAKISAWIHMEKDGMQIEFDPSLLTDPARDPVLLQAKALLKERLEKSRILSARFAERLIDEEALESLPFDFSAVDAEQLASSIVRLVLKEMKDEDGWKAYADAYCSQPFQPYPLRIEMRGKQQ